MLKTQNISQLRFSLLKSRFTFIKIGVIFQSHFSKLFINSSGSTLNQVIFSKEQISFLAFVNPFLFISLINFAQDGSYSFVSFKLSPSAPNSPYTLQCKLAFFLLEDFLKAEQHLIHYLFIK